MHLNKPLATLVVKDRVFSNNPGEFLPGNKSVNDEFIETFLDSSYGMKSVDWLRGQIAGNQALTIVDLRAPKAYARSHIASSINIPLPQLPALYAESLPDQAATIVCCCNGSVQSAYAIMFLYSKGYRRLANLSGGMSAWEKSAGQ